MLKQQSMVPKSGNRFSEKIMLNKISWSVIAIQIKAIMPYPKN